MAAPASDHAHGDYTHGEMDIHQNQSSFHVFMQLAKWGTLLTVAMVIFLVSWFCTTAGFLGGLILGVAVLVIGIVALREKRGAGAH